MAYTFFLKVVFIFVLLKKIECFSTNEWLLETPDAIALKPYIDAAVDIISEQNGMKRFGGYKLLNIYSGHIKVDNGVEVDTVFEIGQVSCSQGSDIEGNCILDTKQPTTVCRSSFYRTHPSGTIFFLNSNCTGFSNGTANKEPYDSFSSTDVSSEVQNYAEFAVDRLTKGLPLDVTIKLGKVLNATVQNLDGKTYNITFELETVVCQGIINRDRCKEIRPNKRVCSAQVYITPWGKIGALVGDTCDVDSIVVMPMDVVKGGEFIDPQSGEAIDFAIFALDAMHIYTGRELLLINVTKAKRQLVHGLLYTLLMDVQNAASVKKGKRELGYNGPAEQARRENCEAIIFSQPRIDMNVLLNHDCIDTDAPPIANMMPMDYPRDKVPNAFVDAQFREEAYERNRMSFAQQMDWDVINRNIQRIPVACPPCICMATACSTGTTQNLIKDTLPTSYSTSRIASESHRHETPPSNSPTAGTTVPDEKLGAPPEQSTGTTSSREPPSTEIYEEPKSTAGKPSTLSSSTLKPSTLKPSTLKPSTLKPSTLKPSTLKPPTLKASTLKPSPPINKTTLAPVTSTPKRLETTSPFISKEPTTSSLASSTSYSRPSAPETCPPCTCNPPPVTFPFTHVTFPSTPITFPSTPITFPSTPVTFPSTPETLTTLRNKILILPRGVTDFNVYQNFSGIYQTHRLILIPISSLESDIFRSPPMTSTSDTSRNPPMSSTLNPLAKYFRGRNVTSGDTRSKRAVDSKSISDSIKDSPNRQPISCSVVAESAQETQQYVEFALNQIFLTLPSEGKIISTDVLHKNSQKIAAGDHCSLTMTVDVTICLENKQGSTSCDSDKMDRQRCTFTLDINPKSDEKHLMDSDCKATEKAPVQPIQNERNQSRMFEDMDLKSEEAKNYTNIAIKEISRNEKKRNNKILLKSILKMKKKVSDVGVNLKVHLLVNSVTCRNSLQDPICDKVSSVFKICSATIHVRPGNDTMTLVKYQCRFENVPQAYP